MRSIRRVKVAVPLDECKRRALRYLYDRRATGLLNASSVAHAIWPEAEFRAQGAGAAASRILKLLINDGLAAWTSREHPFRSWGYEITAAGHARIKGDSTSHRTPGRNDASR